MPTKSTPAKRAASNAGAKVADFDAEREKIIKARKGPKTIKWTVYGRTWDIKRPNVAFVAEQEGEESFTGFISMLTAHIVKDQRADFLKALSEDEDLDFDILAAMVTDMQGRVYANLI